jgi:hypothetical protein
MSSQNFMSVSVPDPFARSSVLFLRTQLSSPATQATDSCLQEFSFCEISGFHSGEYKDDCLLECCAV